MEDGTEEVKAVGDSEGADHPLISGVVVSVQVDAGGPVEYEVVEVGESGVVVELVLEEGEERLGCEGMGEVGFDEFEELVLGGAVGERDCGVGNRGGDFLGRGGE